MPWNDRSIHQLDEYESSMGDLQALLDSHRGCMFVIGGDWNVDKDGCYAARTCVQRFCSVNNLCWLDPIHNSVKFSFHNDVNGHFSLIDHFMCSSSCVGDNVNMTHILVHGANTSDHLAISCNITLPARFWLFR